MVRFADDPTCGTGSCSCPTTTWPWPKHIQGCDVWLNNPLRPLEACGTSGMKAALNGGLNLSVRDGWWDEWYDGENGWAIPSADGVIDPDRRDELEAGAMYELLGGSVAPMFYDRDAAASRPAGSRWCGTRCAHSDQRRRPAGWSGSTRPSCIRPPRSSRALTDGHDHRSLARPSSPRGRSGSRGRGPRSGSSWSRPMTAIRSPARSLRSGAGVALGELTPRRRDRGGALWPAREDDEIVSAPTYATLTAEPAQAPAAGGNHGAPQGRCR